MELSQQDTDKAKFVFSIYDFEGNETIDAVNLGDCLRALDLTPKLKTIAKLGGSNKKGEKKYSLEEFLAIYADAKKDKDVGCLEDYIEVCKMYDKHNDGYMSAHALNHMLVLTGEKMDAESVAMVMNECSDGLDDDGNFKYIPFMKKMCSGPPSTFDDVSFSLSAPAPAPARKPSVRPTITVDEDTPSVSFAAAKPMVMPRKSIDDGEAEEPPVASFTLKAPRKSSTTVQ